VQRGGRIFNLLIALLVTSGLIFMSQRGSLGPVGEAISIPLTAVENLVGNLTGGVKSTAADFQDASRLRQRNRNLEEALAVYQAELAVLREKGQDYARLAALLEYDRQGPEDREYVTCDVIGVDTTSFIRAVQIDCGRRDGVELYDPVVTELGMVGRVVSVTATGSQVLLVTDPNSHVNARLQQSRQDGLVIGQLSGDLVMSFLPIDAEISESDLVMTNGLGQVFPADLLLGQVMSVSLSENELYKEVRVRSLVDFDRLEIVQVIINFEPVDLSVFEDEEE